MSESINSSKRYLQSRLKEWSGLQSHDLYFVPAGTVDSDHLPAIDSVDRMRHLATEDNSSHRRMPSIARNEHDGAMIEGGPVTDKVEEKVLPTDWLTMPDGLGLPVSLDYLSVPLGNMLDDTARRFADKPAVIYQDTQWRYRDFLSLVNRVAAGLARMKVGPGDRVMSTLPNCPEFMAIFFAVQKLGAVLVNTGPLASPEDMDSTIRLTQPKVLVGLDLQAALFAKMTEIDQLDQIVWITLKGYQPLFTRFGYMIKKWQTSSLDTEVNQKSWQSLLTDAPSRPPSISSDMESVALLQPTGGTTGTLKLAQLSHRNLLANALQLNILMKSPLGQDRYLAVLPMFHVFGLSTCLITPILGGASVIPLTRFVPGQVFDALERYRPTIFPLVPAICNALCHASQSDRKKTTPEQTRDLFRTVRICVSGAAPLTDETAASFESMSGLTLLQGFGMTESAPVTACNVPESYRRSAIGHPLPDTVIRVADMNDPSITLARGEVGEMLVAGPQVMRGYYRNPDQTAKVLWEDESGIIWLRTGDLAMIDPDHQLEHADLPPLRIVGRKKHMIIRNGFNIYPEKLEKVLLTHDLIQDAAVIGKTDPELGEQVIAVVVLKDHDKLSAEAISENQQSLLSFARASLGKYEAPAEFIMVPEVPRNGLGKFQAHKLKAQLGFEVPEIADADRIDSGDALEGANVESHM